MCIAGIRAVCIQHNLTHEVEGVIALAPCVIRKGGEVCRGVCKALYLTLLLFTATLLADVLRLCPHIFNFLAHASRSPQYL
jgi:hypothetical protein